VDVQKRLGEYPESRFLCGLGIADFDRLADVAYACHHNARESLIYANSVAQ
jgi:hypothetical protein